MKLRVSTMYNNAHRNILTSKGFVGANHLEILLPIVFHPSALRLVLGGDHLQLPPYTATKAAEKAWGDQTLFESLKKKGFPTTLLNTQYRTHSDLAGAPNFVVYNGTMTPHFKTEQPRPAL